MGDWETSMQVQLQLRWKLQLDTSWQSDAK